MSKPMEYRQCRLRRRVGAAVIEQMAWIPDRFASVGRTVRIKGEGDSWSDGWEVAFASSESVSEEYIAQARHAHTRQRRASDI